jgi:hypothetical protein
LRYVSAGLGVSATIKMAAGTQASVFNSFSAALAEVRL